MITTVRVLWGSLGQLAEYAVVLMASNLVAFVLSLPLVAFSYLVVAGLGMSFFPELPIDDPFMIVVALLVLVPNPMAVGIYRVVQQIIAEEAVSFKLFLSGLQTYFLRGLAVFAISLVVVFMLISSIGFYFNQSQPALKFVGVVFAYLLVVWLGMQLYLYPLLVRQTDRRLTLLFRNSLLICLRYPGFTLSLLVLAAVLAAIASVLMLVVPLVLLSLVALMQSRAVALVVQWEKSAKRLGTD